MTMEEIFNPDFNFHISPTPNHSDLDAILAPSPKTPTFPFSAPVANMGHLPDAQPTTHTFNPMNRFTPFLTTTSTHGAYSEGFAVDRPVPFMGDWYCDRFALSDCEDEGDTVLGKRIGQARKILKRREAERLVDGGEEVASRRRGAVGEKRAEIQKLSAEQIETQMEWITQKRTYNLDPWLINYEGTTVELEPQEPGLATHASVSIIAPSNENPTLPSQRPLRRNAPKPPTIDKNFLAIPELNCPNPSSSGKSPVKQLPIPCKRPSRTPFNSPIFCSESFATATGLGAQPPVPTYPLTPKRTLEEEYKDIETTPPSKKRKAASKPISYAEDLDSDDIYDATPKKSRRSKRRRSV